MDKRTNQVFIYDVPSKLELIRGLLTQIDRPARQVLIEARIIEADSSFGKSLGVRLGGQIPKVWRLVIRYWVQIAQGGVLQGLRSTSITT